MLEEWLTRCNSKRKLDFNLKIVIRSYMKNVKDFKSISLLKLKKENPNLYGLINGNTQNKQYQMVVSTSTT